MNAPGNSGLRRRLLGLFLVALGIRWGYALATPVFADFDGLKFGDSYGYLAMAERFSQAIAEGRVAGWGWLGPDLALMPLFTWSLTAHVAVAGPWAPLTYVLMQGLLDAGTCLAVFGIARALDRCIATWAGYSAAAMPTLVALSGIVYSDTTFVFFAALSLLGAVRWMRAPSWRFAILAGVGLGCAALVRVWIVAWTVPLLLLLAGAAWFRQPPRGGHLLHLGAIVAILAVFLAPVAVRNASLYGSWSLTPQNGVHLAMWIVPLVREAKDGTPRATTVAALETQMRERFGPGGSSNPFVESARYRALAIEELQKLGTAAIMRAWGYGIVINLTSPAITMVPAVAKLPRTGFYDTAGQNFSEKVANFLFRSKNAIYTWLLVGGIVGVVFVRAIQFVGGLGLLARKEALWPILLLFGWALYILAINGPIASPKYRLPLEPVLAVLMGAALAKVIARKRN